MRKVRQFETNRFKLNPTCPCGKSNKDGKFSPQKGYAGQNIGHCHTCGRDFWDNDKLTGVTAFNDIGIPIFCTLGIDDLKDHFDSDMTSGFAQFLTNVFGEDNSREIIERYYLGNYYGDVIFWQMDRDKNLRTGKVFQYNHNGKRQGFPKWWHKIKKMECQVNKYFFGGHLIDESDKPIAIVESEKTACIMSQINANFIWLASGGLTHLSNILCRSISHFDVTLFPDVGFYEQWSEIANKYAFAISKECEYWFKDGLLQKGEDIADYFINNAVKDEVRLIDPYWNQEENDSIFKKNKKVVNS